MTEILNAILAKTSRIKIPNSIKPISVFDREKPIFMTIKDYVDRIDKYIKPDENVYVAALIYIDKLIAKNPRILITVNNVYELIITSVMIAEKFNTDDYMTNNDYAIVGGLDIEELNELERNFLTKIDFELYINSDRYNDYKKKLIEFRKKLKIKENESKSEESTDSDEQ